MAEVAEIGGCLSLDRPGIRELSGLVHRHAVVEIASQRKIVKALFLLNIFEMVG
ncbi:hypothetical protein CE91St62_32650 [Lachnospiraceae bacterium]|uniref:hypothetical protein n=1 Tax=Extibacter sp. GGCC_0201 TaxID=2731209 RepID=UPI001AA0E50B|nr:hypothetical protein [Extibacter sp. GGCC_0201]MBO1721526.1 hypothetical protein [Extibacter sp. GGCC_0201]BDF35203.1 hypothetical protein CE91St61_32780 [Lachnospiraceae bacterium]BDF39204.1 hypothetical protein CE91St62_32650 [Lachnospiraceae bacterium]